VDAVRLGKLQGTTRPAIVNEGPHSACNRSYGPSGPLSPGTLDEKPHVTGVIAFILVLVAGLGYAALSIVNDINSVGEHWR
jgi:hypothetical protein